MPDTVYCVWVGFAYEGDVLKLITMSKEKAEALAEKYKALGRWDYVYFSTETMEKEEDV